MRTLLLIAAVVLAVSCVAVELGRSFVFSIGETGPSEAERKRIDETYPSRPSVLPDKDVATFVRDRNEPPGKAITYLALIDGLVLLGIGLVAATYLVPPEVFGSAQAIARLIVSFLTTIWSFVAVFAAITLLIVMVMLLTSPIFGTIAYFVLYGFFPRGTAAALIATILLLKIAAVVCMVVAHPLVLRMKSLVFLVASSIVLTLAIPVLHAFPAPIVSITDMIGAIVIAIVALVWALWFFITAVISTVKLLKLVRVDRLAT